MRLLSCLVICLAASVVGAHAQLSRNNLDTVGIHAKPGAAIPENLVFRDIAGKSSPLADHLNGRPAVMMFADYTCRTLCGTTIAMVSAALAKSGLTPGKDYALVIIGMDPKDTARDAEAMKADYLKGDLVGPETAFLLGDEKAVHAATRAAGYSYVYDRQADQFAHPTGAYVLSPDGKISQVLTTIGLSAETVRLALVEAGKGSIGNFGDYVRLLCYCYDPATGKYSGAILGWLRGLGFATVAAMGLGILFMARKRRSQDADGERAS